MSSKIIHDAMALTAITLVAGLALGAVHGITKEPIARQEELAKQEAYQEVFPEAQQFEALKLDENLAQQIRTGLDEEGYTQDSIQEVMTALDAQGQQLGYAITILSTAGYGGEIQFSMGVSMDGTVGGISFLSISETAGLGMKADTKEFRSQFAGKQVEAFTYTKNGASAEDEIDAISGATITTSAVTDGVNAGLCTFRILES